MPSLERNNRMERVTRLELATHSLGSYCSTTELYPQFWWKEQPSKSSCINYSIKRAFLQVLFHQNKKPASQRAFLLRATIPGPPAGSAHAFGQAKSPLIWPLPRTTFFVSTVAASSRDASTIFLFWINKKQQRHLEHIAHNAVVVYGAIIHHP